MEYRLLFMNKFVNDMSKLYFSLWDMTIFHDSKYLACNIVVYSYSYYVKLVYFQMNIDILNYPVTRYIISLTA